MCESTQHGRYGLFKPGLQEEYYYSKTQVNQGGAVQLIQANSL